MQNTCCSTARPADIARCVQGACAAQPHVSGFDRNANVFPQKCSRFHLLSAFSGSNRTCVKQLEKQNASRRARRGGAEPPSSAGSPPTASASPPLTPAFAAVAAEPLVGAFGELSYDASLFAFVDQTLLSASWQLPDLPAAPVAAPPDRALALAAWGGCELPSLRSVSLKLGGANPGQLSPTLAPALAAAWCDDLALCIEAAPRPGCTLLHIDALLPARASAAPDASRLLRELLASPAGDWLRTRAVTLRTCTGDAAAAEPGSAGGAAPSATPPPPPRPPQLLPLALPSTAPATLHASGWSGPPPGCQLWLRLHGQVCTLRCEGGVVALPALGSAEGAARLWLAQDGAAGGAERTVLLTRDAAIAAEVASLESDGSEATEQLLCVLGAALRPGCAPRVLAAAAAEALSRAWEATCARLLPLLRAALDAGACDAEARAAARALLHAAALSGRPALVLLTMSLSADGALGLPYGLDPRSGMTPMHLAAMAGDGATAEALASHSPAALVAWFHVRSRDGVTAADVARAAGDAAARTHAALSRRLNSARALASELAAVASDDAAQSEGAPPQQFDDMALARFLLHTFAPADPTAPAVPDERQLYEAQRLVSRRLQSLCFPPFAVAAMLRRLLITGPTSAAIAAISPHVEPTFQQAWAAYQNVEQFSRMCVVLSINVALLALAGLPQLRGVYKRHGVAALRMFALLQFLVLPALAEMHVRSTLGFAVKWPAIEGMIFIASMTTHMALLPLPCRDSVALLCARWSQMMVARLTGAPIWQGSAATVGTTVVASVVHASLAVLVVVMDRRAWAAWRLGRRARLAEQLPLKQA